MSMFLGKRRFIFEHVDTGDQAYVEVFAEAADQGDKRASKAMTLAKKYALREFFLIETGDDPDAEVSPRAKSDNVYNRALMAIESSTTIEELNDKWSSINSYQDVVWKGDQVSKLLTAVEKKKEQLAGVTDD